MTQFKPTFGTLAPPQVQQLFDNLLEGFQIISPEWKYLYVNETVSRHGKKSKEELLGKTMMEVYPGIENTEMFKILRSCMEKREPGEMENEFAYPDGSKAWFELRFEPVPEGVFILSIDISNRKMAEEKLKWMLYHDEPSGLPNQKSLIQSLDLEMEYGKTKNHPGILILVLLKNAMEIESSFGISSRDELLYQLEQHFEILLPSCKIYKADSNQLALIVRSSLSSQLTYILNDIQSAIRMPFQVGNLSLHGDFCVGYVHLDNPSKGSEYYLKAAKRAAVIAYNKHNIIVEHNSTFEKEIRENLEIMGELKYALEAGTVDFHYQPKVLLKDGSILGAEALIRWDHPVLGPISPESFIPRAEKSANIDLLTQLAISKALEKNFSWRESGMSISTAVNISTRNLLMPNFVEMVLELLNIYDMPSESLELEITEGELMLDMKRSIMEITKLVDSKITVSIDDFGTGYSSLQYLNQLPVSIIKMDKSFITDLPHHPGKVCIVESTIELCKKLGIKIVAEGVETYEAYHFLKNLGCDMAQGFYMSPPLEANSFKEWFKNTSGIFQPQSSLINSR